MIKQLITISVLSASLLAIGCGKDKEGKGGSKAPADNGPTLDCPAFTAKMTECLETFAPAYAQTEFGGKAGQQLDGTFDREMAASNFKKLFGMKGEALCSEYGTRDGRWKVRFAACDNTVACDAWVPCMATAMGEMLPTD